MATGDGLLVRLHPRGGVLSSDALRAIAEAAERAGNGLIDVTGRGNLQIRGVRPEAHADLVVHLRDIGLGDPRTPGGPQRLTLAPPLAGLDPSATFDAFALAEAIEGESRTLPGLHPKLLVAVEDGGRGGVGDVAADVVLRPDGRGILVLGLAGTAMGWALPSESAPAVTTILARLAALGPRRVRDLSPAEREHLTRDLTAVGELAPASPNLPPGPIDLGSGRFALAADLPFGRGAASLFAKIAAQAMEHGVGTVRLTPTRGVLISGLAVAGLDAVEVAARAAGLILDAADPRRAVAACPGAPACASGHAPVQADAARVAGALASRGTVAHVSGCAKGCAHPGPADLTLVAAEGGYDVVLAGDARATPRLRLPLPEILARLAAPLGLAEAFPTRYGAPGDAVTPPSSTPAPPRSEGLRNTA